MRLASLTTLVAVGLGLIVAASPPDSDRWQTDSPEPVVIAIMGETGLNVLHEDFREVATGPQPDVPLDVETIELNRAGDFKAQLAWARSETPLAGLARGMAYRPSGTRIAAIYVAPAAVDGDPAGPFDLLSDRSHGTAVASAAIGAVYGTAPDAWLVFVPEMSRSAWEWVAEQDWIDLVSASYATLASDGAPDNCPEGASIRAIAAAGRVVLAAAGNGEQYGTLASPSGHPDVIRVGGVNGDGTPYIYGSQAPAGSVPNHPYDVGHLYVSEVASPSSLAGSSRFPGTSGAAPRAAGAAANLILDARGVLGDDGSRPREGALAVLGSRALAPATGPLADGRFTSDELIETLLATARPSLQSEPGRYYAEGFGALTADAASQAAGAIRGDVPLPERRTDWATRDAHRQALRPAYGPPRC